MYTRADYQAGVLSNILHWQMAASRAPYLMQY